MPNSGQELVPWTQEQWTAIQEAVDKTLAATAKSRHVVPKGSDSNGEKAVVVPTIQAGPPISYGPDRIVTPVHVYADATLDDQHAAKQADIQRLIETTAALLGGVEDQEVLLGPAGAPAPPRAGAPPARLGRFARNGALARDGLNAAGAAPPIPIGAGGGNPNGGQLYAAITNAVATLEGAGRPGRFGLLVHDTLMATLRQPRVPGGVPLIQEVEGLIGSNEIVGTSALDGTFNAGAICGVLLRLEPPAADIVHTQLPTVTVLGRAAGSTDFRVEEEIAVRVLDPAAIQTIAY
jgi:hypothetical protein